MECCSKCFKKVCRCGSYKVEIDYYIYPAIYELNRKGYITTGCCSGHVENGYTSIYIKFAEEIEEDISSEYFEYESYNYRGFHERRNCIRLKSEIVKKFQKKRTNKLKLIQEVNKDLYRWAKSLPYKIEPQVKAIELPEEYFDQEVENEEVVDVQKPWLLFTKSSKYNGRTINDFFSEMGNIGELTEVVVNNAGRIKRFDDKDYSHNQNGGLLKSKIEFDISGEYKSLLCGYEPYMMVEQLLVENARWYLSYARTDLAIRSTDEDECFSSTKYTDDEDIDDYQDEDYDDIVEDHNANNVIHQMEPLVDEYDVEDYFDEHSDVKDIDLFAHLFNRMCRMGINICVFSADNINIVFTNKTDFSTLMVDGQNVIAFGEAAYDDIDFTHIGIERKEYLMYVNGRLLLRKELE